MIRQSPSNRVRTHWSRTQTGVAMVTALLIVAIATSAAAFISLGQQVWLRQAQNLFDGAQAKAVRSGALDWAAIILAEDAKDNTTDDLTQPWAQPLPPLPAEGGLVTGRIIDAQGRFNLNNVVRNGNPSTEDIAVLQRLLDAHDLPRELADTLVDWLDADSQTQPNGAEDIDYLSTEQPYRAANQRLQTVQELRLIKGFDAKAVDLLRPFVTALPQATAININTAEPVVFGAMFVDLSLSEAEDLLAQRKENPFKDTSELKAQLPPDVAPPKVPYDVKSAYFEVTIDSLFGRLQRRTQALLHRPAKGSVQVLWQQQQLLITATDDGDTG